MGKGGLGLLELFQQLTAAFLTIGKHLNDLKPVGIAKGFAKQGNIGSNHKNHLT